MQPLHRIRICRAARVLLCLAAAALAALSSGCTSLAYYSQGIVGELEVLHARRPLEVVIASPKTRPAVQNRLASAVRIRHFAATELGLSDHGSFRTYSDLGREYVVWNVFATPELSLESAESCFAIIGCLSYRGYFHEQDARTFAQTLRARGDDVFVAGVAAYSTLGLFNDPILSSMLHLDDSRLGRVVIHELAHQRLYIRNDSEFNEAFAEFVAQVGWQRWLAREATTAQIAAFCTADQRDRGFRTMLFHARHQLEHIYTSALPASEKRALKTAAYADLRLAYETFKRHWDGYSGFDAWMNRDLNNAKLAAVATYYELMPAFARLLAASNGDLDTFYDKAAALGRLDSETRHLCLSRLANAAKTAPSIGSATATGGYLLDHEGETCQSLMATSTSEVETALRSPQTAPTFKGADPVSTRETHANSDSLCASYSQQ